MKNYTIALLALASLTLMSFSMVAKSDKTVKLSEVSAPLKPYEGVAGQDFVGNSVTYKSIGKDNYDKVFRESALIYATMVQLKGTIDGINKGTFSAESEFATANISFATSDIPGMKDRITKLQEQLQNLSPKNDFKGLEMKKAPEAADGINIAKKHLAEASAMLPDIAKSIEEIAKKLVRK